MSRPPGTMRTTGRRAERPTNGKSTCPVSLARLSRVGISKACGVTLPKGLAMPISIPRRRASAFAQLAHDLTLFGPRLPLGPRADGLGIAARLLGRRRGEGQVLSLAGGNPKSAQKRRIGPPQLVRM